MTNADTFDQYLTKYKFGLRFDRTRAAGRPAAAVYARVQEIADALIGNARSGLPRLPNIHFDFIYNGEVQAIAFKESGQYFIGVTTGAIAMLEILFHRMLGNPRLLMHVGEPGLEDLNLPPITGLLPDAQRMVASGVKPTPPKSATRWAYASHLFEQAIIFLIGHELAHITRGHVDYLNAKKGMSFIAELGWKSASQEAAIERQMIECDADYRSFLSRLSSAKLTADSAKSGVPLPDAMSLDALIFAVTFAMNTLCRLFGDDRFSQSELMNDAYPPWPLRRAIAMQQALLALNRSNDARLFETAKNAFQKAIDETERAFRLITGDETSSSSGGIVDAIGAAGMKHMNDLIGYWVGGLRDQLASFAYENLLRNASRQDVSDSLRNVGLRASVSLTDAPNRVLDASVCRTDAQK